VKGRGWGERKRGKQHRRPDGRAAGRGAAANDGDGGSSRRQTGEQKRGLEGQTALDASAVATETSWRENWGGSGCSTGRPGTSRGVGEEGAGEADGGGGKCAGQPDVKEGEGEREQPLEGTPRDERRSWQRGRGRGAGRTQAGSMGGNARSGAAIVN
jgi:hypothetical protein